MKTRIVFIFFLSIVLLNAQSAKETIKKIQNKFNSIENFTANFSQSLYAPSGGEQGKVNGKFSYKRKNKFVVELKNQTIVSNGETIWNYDKKFNRVVVSYLNDDPTSFSLEKFIFDYPPLCKTKMVKDPTNGSEFILELVPKDNDLQFKLVRIWKSLDNLISKMELVDVGDMKYSFAFRDVKVNQELASQVFTFNAPKGTKVIDLR
ncbi:MAG: outer membrane lipoprotein carrier protein LolA [Melioribacteraceae bacterium]